MKKISEGNLYNTEMEISHISQPTPVGLENWKKEVKRFGKVASKMVKYEKNRRLQTALHAETSDRHGVNC